MKMQLNWSYYSWKYLDNSLENLTISANKIERCMDYLQWS